MKESEMADKDTTQQGLVQALLAGDIDTDQFLDMSEELGGQAPKTEEAELDEVQAFTCPRCGSVGVVPTAGGTCPHCGTPLPVGEQTQPGAFAPGVRTRGSAGRGAPSRGVGAARGRGPGPRGIPAGIKREPAVGAGNFESLVSEACKMKRKPKKGKKKESLKEFVAPEWREVAMWARGQEVKRNAETQPYYFQEDKMFSRKVQIAVRDLKEKKAKVLSPKVLDAYSGRHSVLAQHGLKSCGYAVEVVESL